MADSEVVTDAQVTENQESVVDEGNLAFGEIQGRFAQAFEEAQGEAEVSEEGEGDSAEQATNEEPETESDSEDEELASDEESDDDDDVLSELKPSAAKRARKRIDKLTARAKEAEEKSLALESRLQRLESGGAQPQQQQDLTFTNKVEKAQTFDELKQLQEVARQTYEWADDNSDEHSVELNGTEYTRDQIKQLKKEARNVMERVIPSRAQKLKTQYETQQAVLQRYPAWQDKDHADHPALMENWSTIVQLGLQDHPYAMAFASRLLDAKKYDQLRAKQGNQGTQASTETEQPKPARKRDTPPSLPTADDTVAPSSSNSGDEVSKIEQLNAGKTSLSQEDMVAYFAAKERAKRNRKG